MSDTYSAADIAKKLGLSLDRFYRRRARLHAVDGMPEPISSIGRPRWHKPTIVAWLGRHHPLAPKAPAANDSENLPRSVAQERARLEQVYGGR